jgi:hypothetical protein
VRDNARFNKSVMQSTTYAECLVQGQDLVYGGAVLADEPKGCAIDKRFLASFLG